MKILGFKFLPLCKIVDDIKNIGFQPSFVFLFVCFGKSFDATKFYKCFKLVFGLRGNTKTIFHKNIDLNF